MVNGKLFVEIHATVPVAFDLDAPVIDNFKDNQGPRPRTRFLS